MNHQKSTLAIALLAAMILSCNWAKDKTKQTIHKGGEIAGKAGSEVADGIRQGVEESFSNLIEISPNLVSRGIHVGRILVSGTDSSTDNKVSVYMIFDSNFDGQITAKAFDKKNKEFGRTRTNVVAGADEAKYIDFLFDQRTNLDRGDKVRLE